MTATQAPTPGPLSVEITYEVYQDGDFCASSTRLQDAEHYAGLYGQDGPVKCHTVVSVRHDDFLLPGDARLAPTAPVEASGSELTAAQRRSMSIQAAPPVDDAEAAGCAEPQVGRAVYERIENLLKTDPTGWERAYLCHLVGSVEEVGGYDGPRLDGFPYRKTFAAFLKLRDESVGPGEADDEERLESADIILSLTTPARAKAQDEGAAGSFETAEAMAEAWSDRVEIQRMVETTSAVFAKWASPELLSRFRQQMMAVIQQAYVEGVSARVEALAAANPSPTPAADADRVRKALEAAFAGFKIYAGVTIKAIDVQHLVDLALAALKSTAAKEGGEL